MFVRGVLTAALAGAVWVGAGVAFAHDPIIIAPEQTTPESGPLLLDGTVSFALYGVVDAPGATRGLRAQFAEGDQVNLSLLVPALDPEQTVADVDMPTLTMARPDGTSQTFTTTERVRFDESFSNTSYVRLLEVDEPAQAGVYGFTVSAAVPARFTVAVGSDERFGTPVENAVDRAGASAGIASWYSTPPTTTLAPQTGGVDGAAGSAVFVGAIVVVLAGAGYLFWSKRRRPPA